MDRQKRECTSKQSTNTLILVLGPAKPFEANPTPVHHIFGFDLSWVIRLNISHKGTSRISVEVTRSAMT